MSYCTERQKKTPDYFHVLKPPFRQNVYEPEADTFLFLDALDAVAKELHPSFCSRSALLSAPFRCVEIGCGSGAVIAHLGQLLLLAPPKQQGDEIEVGESNEGLSRPSSCASYEFHAVDVNSLALEATQLTWNKTICPILEENSAAPSSTSLSWVFRVHCGDLFGPFATTVESSDVAQQPCETALLDGPELFDLILFNPPYVPTSQEELSEATSSGDVIKRAWCGGPRGRVVLDRFLKQLPRWLRPGGGKALVVLIKQNDVDDVADYARHQFPPEAKFSTRIVAARYTGEELCVLEISV
jgi:release factor glutamine methyltransferase